MFAQCSLFLKPHYSWIKLDHFFQGSWRHSILLRTVFIGIVGRRASAPVWTLHDALYHKRAPFMRFQTDLKVMIVRLGPTDLFLNPVINIMKFRYNINSLQREERYEHMELLGAADTKRKQKEASLVNTGFMLILKPGIPALALIRNPDCYPIGCLSSNRLTGEVPWILTPLNACVCAHADRNFLLVLLECHFVASCGISFTSSVNFWSIRKMYNIQQGCY